MEIVNTVAALRETLRNRRTAGGTVGLVPTMGALHQGHLSLVERARRDNATVVVSVFVNPTQFNNANDLATYPRTEEADCRLLDEAGVDIAFVPSVDEIYPEGNDTRVFDLGPVAEVMEGAMRPGHFNGVAQIVSKLFAWAKPTRAYFGEKDFQQIAVIRRMVELEGFDLEIVPCPIVRETDGLALSSRNVRLSPEARAIAPQIHRILADSVDLKKQGYEADQVEKLTLDAINNIDGLEAEYYSIVDARTMQPISRWADAGDLGAAGCATVYCGGVRLIDNIRY